MFLRMFVGTPANDVFQILHRLALLGELPLDSFYHLDDDVLPKTHTGFFGFLSFFLGRPVKPTQDENRFGQCMRCDTCKPIHEIFTVELTRLTTGFFTVWVASLRFFFI